MILRPPRYTRTDTLFPYTTHFRSHNMPGRHMAIITETMDERKREDIGLPVGRRTTRVRAGPRGGRRPALDTAAFARCAGSPPLVAAARRDRRPPALDDSGLRRGARRRPRLVGAAVRQCTGMSARAARSRERAPSRHGQP